MKASCLFLLAAFLIAGNAVEAEEAFTILGPVETLDNGVVVVQVALKVGRIVAYHRKGEANWLAISDTSALPNWHWPPWGGDRIVPAPQFLSPQIYGTTGSDDVIDGEPWTLVAKSASTLEMRSGVSPQLGLQVTRRIELLPRSTTVLHTLRFERVRTSSFPVHAWTLTTVRPGDCVLMESTPRVTHPKGKPFRWWPVSANAAAPQAFLIENTRTLKIPAPAAMMKLGTFGRWIALVSGTSAFRQEIEDDPALPYLDSSNLQAYEDPAKQVCEIETLSPAWFLRTGEVREWRVSWSLVDLPRGASDHDISVLLDQAR